MTIERRRELSTWLILSGILLLIIVNTTGCGSVDAIFTAVGAALDGIGIVLTGLGAAISPPISALISEALDTAQALLGGLKSAYDAYEADTADTAKLAKLKAALAAFQAALPALLTQADVNATLASWITKVTGLVTELVGGIVSEILPLAEAGKDALESHREELETKAKMSLEAFTAGYDAATVEVVPAELQKSVHDDYHHRIAHHIGPVRV